MDLYIFGNGNSERDKFFRESYSRRYPEKTAIFSYNVETEAFTHNDDTKEYSLRADFTNFLKGIIRSTGDRIFIDITSMPIPFMFYLFSTLSEIKPRQVLCGYSKPIEYLRNSIENERDIFELSEKFVGIKPIPGFLRSDKQNRDKILVLFLGYEGKRAKYVNEEEGSKSIVPVIGLPGFHPGWHDTAFEMNLELIRESLSVDEVEYVAADSPFEAFELLHAILRKHENKYLVISPLSTKAISLGVALFTLRFNENTSIIYDNPIEKLDKSKGYYSSIVYDISEFI